MKLTSANDAHNHVIDKNLYIRKHLKLSEQEKDYIKSLSQNKVASRQISNLVETNFAKKIDPQRIRNFARRCGSRAPSNDCNLMEYLKMSGCYFKSIEDLAGKPFL